MLNKTDPQVYLVGSSHANWLGLERYLQMMGFEDFVSDGPSDAEKLIEYAGRVCYLSFEKTRPAKEGMTRNATYIRHLMKVGHESVFEHVTFNFIFAGIDRAVSHELVRHRVGTAFSQLSSRYVDQFAFDGLGITMRKELNTQECDMVRQYYDVVQAMYESLGKSLKSRGFEGKKAREICATLLPNASETQMLFSVNLRELRHIFKMRCAAPANASIRRLFMEVYRCVTSVWPVLVSDFTHQNDAEIGPFLEWSQVT